MVILGGKNRCNSKVTIQFLCSSRTCNEHFKVILQSENLAKVKMTVVQLEKKVGSQTQNCTPISPPCWSLSCSPSCENFPLYRYIGAPDCHGRRTPCPAHTYSCIPLVYILEWTSVSKHPEILVPEIPENTFLHRSLPKDLYHRWQHMWELPWF